MTKRTISAFLAATFALCASAAWADEPGSARDLQQQLQQLQQQVKELQAERPAPAYTADDVDATVDSVLHDSARRSQLLAETGGFMGGWMDGKFTIRSEDGNYSLSPGIIFQYRNITTYSQNGGSTGSDNTDNGFEVRRLRFILEGTAITKDLSYRFQWNTNRTTGNMFNEEAYIQYKFADNFSVKVGQYKEFIYHEQSVPITRQLAVDRSLLNEVFNGGESFVQGVDLLWDNNSNLHADIAFTDGYNSFNTNFQDPPTNPFDFGVHGRVEWLVCGKDFKGYNALTAMGGKSGDFVVLGAGADYSQNGDMSVIHHNADVQWNSGPLSVYAAYVGLYTDFGNGSVGTAGSSYDYGLVAQAGYMINTQWEAFARYDCFHLDNQAAGSEDQFHEAVLGVNYYLHGANARITVDVGWLPNGSPSSQTGIGVLANNGENEFFIRGQFQLVL
jgi:hypothetical protein